jgi:hypothetical protein
MEAAMSVIGRKLATMIGAPAREESEEHPSVGLTHPVKHNGDTLPAGTPGVIVHRHSDGVGYEVEFETPEFAVVTLTGSDLTKHG